MRQNGRQKGTPNKLTAQGRALIQGFLDQRTPEELEKLWRAGKADSPSRAFRILAMLMEFASPKLQRTTIVGDDSGCPADSGRLPPAPSAHQAAISPGIPPDAEQGGNFLTSPMPVKNDLLVFRDAEECARTAPRRRTRTGGPVATHLSSPPRVR
jgi:hypothetical protein